MWSSADVPWLAAVAPSCQAFAALLHPHAEVVVHDLASDTIVAIWNPLSGRRVGDPSLIDELPHAWRARAHQGPYRKVLADGRELSAVSAVVHDARGEPRGLLCVNLDRAPLTDMVEALLRFAAPSESAPPELVDRDWREQIALLVDERCRERGWRRGALSRPARVELVAELEQRGLFATRHAATHIATALGVSRATVYALVKEVRDAHVTA